MAIGSIPGTRTPYGEGRQALVDAAIRLVAGGGFSRLTTRALTKEAGVSQGGLQHHFRSLSDVVTAALEQCVITTLSYLRTPATLSEVFDDIVTALRENRAAAVFQTEIFLEAKRHPGMLKVVTDYQQLYVNNLRHTLAELGIPADDDLVQLIVAIGDGIAYQFAVFGPDQLAIANQQVESMRTLLARRPQPEDPQTLPTSAAGALLIGGRAVSP